MSDDELQIIKTVRHMQMNQTVDAIQMSTSIVLPRLARVFCETAGHLAHHLAQADVRLFRLHDLTVAEPPQIALTR
ncbi:MAG: hypothetical protein AAF525_12130 [Pseudomonadota bacterium]